MSHPFKNTEELNQALEGFSNELYELRNKWNLSDVLVVIRDTIESQTEESAFYLVSHIGDSSKSRKMAAYAYGKLKKQDEAAEADILNGNAE